MVSRFHRLAAPPEVTFFVFQDILTSMIGVMIMVTLTLGLQIDDGALEGSHDVKAEGILSQSLDQTLSDVSALRSRLATMGNTAGYTPSLASIEAEEASLRSQIAVYGQSNQARQEKAGQMIVNPADAIIAGEIKGMSVMSARIIAESDRLKSIVQEGEKRLADATRAVRSAESQLMAEKNQQGVLRLIPEISGTTKEPVLVDVNREGFKMTRFDTQTTAAEGSVLDFPNSLKKLKSSDQFVVLFFRPSAAHQFNDYVKTAKNAGFEVGYDLLGEDVRFEFSK